MAPHVYELFDSSNYVAAVDLGGRDVTVTIERVVGGTVEGDKGRKNKRPVVHFKGATKPMVFNKTNTKIVMKLYGTDHTKWVGKRITLYPTTTSMQGDTVPCIRVRPSAPGSSTPDSPIATETGGSQE